MSTRHGGPVAAPPVGRGLHPVTQGPTGTPVQHPGVPFDWDAWLKYLTGSPPPSAVNEVATPRVNGIPQPTDRVPIGYGEQLVTLVPILQDTGDRLTANFLFGAVMGESDGLISLFCNGTDVTTSFPGISYSFFAGGPAGFTDSWVDAALLARGVTPHTGPYALNVTCFRVLVQSPSLNVFGGPGKWQDMIPNASGGITFTARMRLRRIYDPRLDSTNGGSGAQRVATPASWAYSKNPVLVLRDALTNPLFGARLPDVRIGDASFAAGAAICDATIGSPAQTRFEYSGLITAQTSLKSLIDAVRITANAEPYIEGGLLKVFVDVENAGGPAYTFDSRYNLTNERFTYPTTRDAPTRVSVEFANAAANPPFKLDKTPDLDHPLLASGGVELRAATYRSEGTTDARRARRIAAYILNRATFAQTFSGELGFAGILLGRGTKIRVNSSKGIDAEFLIDEARRQSGGLWSGNGRIYDASIYSESAVAITGTVGDPVEDPTATPDDITVTGASPLVLTLPSAANPQFAITTNTATQVTTSHFATFDFEPPLFRWAAALVVRFDPVGYGTATWASMAASEVVIPLNALSRTGNLPAPFVGTGSFFVPTLVGETDSDLFFPNGEPEAWGLTSGGGWRLIVKVRSQLGNDSAGVTVDAPAYSSSGSSSADGGAYLIAKPLGLIEDTLPSVSASGEATIAMDVADHTVKMSVDGGAFAPIGSGGGGGSGTAVQARVAMTGSLQTINSGTATDITGATVSFTPTVTGLHLIIFDFDVAGDATAASGEQFVGEIKIAGTAQATQGVFNDVNARAVVSNAIAVNLTASTAYTIKLCGRVNSYASKTYSIAPTHTGFVIVAPSAGGGGGGGGISSINGDTTAAQTIAGAGTVSVSTVAGVTTVTGSGGGAATQVLQENFAGDGATTAFVLGSAPITDGVIAVSVDGLIYPITAWSLGGSTITFGTAPSSGALISVSYFTTLAGSLTKIQEDFSGAGSTDVTLAHAPSVVLVVARGEGLVQTQASWIIVSGTTLRFSSTLDTGEGVSAVYLY